MKIKRRQKEENINGINGKSNDEIKSSNIDVSNPYLDSNLSNYSVETVPHSNRTNRNGNLRCSPIKVTFAENSFLWNGRNRNGIGKDFSSEIMTIPAENIDNSTSTEDLLELVKHLRYKVSSTEVDLSDEKAQRKKKEKNIIKLAKQLHVKTSEIEKRDSEIGRVLADKSSLQAQLSRTKRALVSLQSQNEKSTRDYHSELTVLQSSHRALTKEHDHLLSLQQTKYTQQIEELRRDILQSKLESDRLRMQLASLEMKIDPKKTDKIVTKTLRDATAANTVQKDKIISPITKSSIPTLGSEKVDDYYESIKLWRIVGILVAVVIVPTILIAKQMNLLTANAICAPCMPGTVINNNTTVNSRSFEAPWWVPDKSLLFSYQLKPVVFDWMCSNTNHRRMRIQWISLTKSKRISRKMNGKSNKSDINGEERQKLIVTDILKAEAGSGSFNNNNNKAGVLLEKKILSATVNPDVITFTYNGGKVEKKKAPWAVNTGKQRGRKD